MWDIFQDFVLQKTNRLHEKTWRFVHRNKTSLPFEHLLKKDETVNIQQWISIMWLIHIFRKFIFYWHYPETLKYWVDIQWGQSYLMGRRCLFSFGWQALLVMVSQYHNGINQLCTPAFSIGFVKTKSDFIVGLFVTSLGKWSLVVAVISVDAYPFLAFWVLTCHLEDTGIGVFWLHIAAW